jgi:hypothetical protein
MTGLLFLLLDFSLDFSFPFHYMLKIFSHWLMDQRRELKKLGYVGMNQHNPQDREME